MQRQTRPPDAAMRQGEARPWVRRVLIISATAAAVILFVTIFIQ